ncbi:MAG: DUF952 domain-containing protein [Stappiaceae bacterium]
MSSVVYKIVPQILWQEAERVGVFTGAAIDLSDGFIHFSTSDQVRETAAKHFAGQRDLLLVAIDVPALGDDLKWEVSRGGALFPHLYADLPMAAVIWMKPLPIGDDGLHLFPELVA